MMSIEEARECLRIDGPDNDMIIQPLLDAIPDYIEIATGMRLYDQWDTPLARTVSKFILQLWYNAEQSESERLQAVIDNLLKAISAMVQ